MKKLVLFGDSLFGQVGKRTVLMFEDRLPDYDVYNCATGGWDTTDCVQKAPFIAKLEPDVLVMSLGTNDASPWKQVSLDVFKRNLPQLFNNFNGTRLIYFLPPPADVTKSREEGKEITNSDLQPYYLAAKELCDQHHVEYIDSLVVFQPLLDSGQDYHIEDGIHLNDFGYEVIAEQLAKLLN